MSSMHYLPPGPPPVYAYHKVLSWQRMSVGAHYTVLWLTLAHTFLPNAHLSIGIVIVCLRPASQTMAASINWLIKKE